MMEVLEANPRLENILGAQNYWPEPDRPSQNSRREDSASDTECGT